MRRALPWLDPFLQQDIAILLQMGVEAGEVGSLSAGDLEKNQLRLQMVS